MKKKYWILFLSIFFIFDATAQTKIFMEKRGGVYYLPCKVNGIPLKMVFDTGASNVSIAIGEAIVMIRNGTLTDDDILGTTRFTIANGTVITGTAIILRRVEIGQYVLSDVKANIVHTLDAPLLLGQSVLQRLGNIQVDFSSNCIIINNNPTLNNPSYTDNQVIIEPGKFNGMYKYSTTIKDDIQKARLWSSPDSIGYVIGIIPKYIEIFVIDDSSPYFRKVNVNGKIGYVNPNCLKKLK